MTIEVQVNPVDENTVEGRIVFDGRGSRIRTTATVRLDSTATPWLPPSTVLAATLGDALTFDGGVDPRALAGAQEAAHLLRSWYPDMVAVDVAAVRHAVPGPTPGTGDRGVGCFFSGGLDAFYTVLKNRDEITHLILVHGFDISPTRRRPYERISAVARTVAAELGMDLIEVRTDVQFLHAQHGGNWATAAHGAALAHVALLLSPHLHKVIIAASYDDEQTHPHGSHPDLDRLWSSSLVDIVHDGTEANRVAKAQAVKHSDLAMRYLRVCSLATDDEYNCAKCEKCIRTMINLYVVDALERCETLPDEVSAERIRRTYVREAAYPFVEENLRALRTRGGMRDRELEDALENVLSRSALRHRLLKYRWLVLDVGPRLPRSLLRLAKFHLQGRSND